ncbi:hypothetical protein J4417_04265 [Candidatus Woesearchaeota archaeon]|nr:hypothetical protein [Candidatus Woesearchaeota archaeon]
MDLKAELEKRAPSPIQNEPDFRALLEVASSKLFDTKDGLLAHIKEEIQENEDWLKQNSATGLLGTLRKAKEYTERYL